MLHMTKGWYFKLFIVNELMVKMKNPNVKPYIL